MEIWQEVESHRSRGQKDPLSRDAIESLPALKGATYAFELFKLRHFLAEYSSTKFKESIPSQITVR